VDISPSTSVANRARPDPGLALVFLEINSAPMFARFDAVAGGALCDATIA
jgi:hypothetical protein